MQLTLKYHGELPEDFTAAGAGARAARIDIEDGDTIYSVFEKFNIPPENINLILVNGVRVKDCGTYRFSDGDILAVWPATA